MENLSAVEPDRELDVGSKIIITGEVWTPEVFEPEPVSELTVEVVDIVHLNRNRTYAESPVHHVVLRTGDGRTVYAYPNFAFAHVEDHQ